MLASSKEAHVPIRYRTRNSGSRHLSDEQLRETSLKSIHALKVIGPEIYWLHSYVAGDKIYCVYLAPDEATVQEHARRMGLPANRVSAVRRLLDPVNMA
jgi:Nickel responsive protein SCO4226-like